MMIHHVFNVINGHGFLLSAGSASGLDGVLFVTGRVFDIPVIINIDTNLIIVSTVIVSST